MADKYDIYFKPITADAVRGYKCFEFGYAAALKVKGLNALVNRWVKTFMTPKGSDMLYPSEGTNFSNLLGSNISQRNGVVDDLILLAVEEANDQVIQQDFDGLYALEEQLQSATLIDLKPGIDGVDVWVQIQNKADSSVSVRVATVG